MSVKAIGICLTLVAAPLFADDSGAAESARELARREVLEAADALDRALGALDGATLKQLVDPGATHLSIFGLDTRPLLADYLRARTRRSGAEQEPDQVVRKRHVRVMDELAIVEELLGAAGGVESPQVPQRRSVVWARSNSTWRVQHVHTSAYTRWESSIRRFESQDQETPPAPRGIVFIGSSSIRGWKTLQVDFPGQNVIGRGFGGSQMIDSILYAHRIVLPYRPRAVVVYAGDNDMGQGKSAEQVFADFQAFVAVLHATDPRIRVGFIAIKPSLSRWKLWPKMRDANALVKKWAAKHAEVTFFDIATPMLGEDGTPNKALFVKDGLHMTPQGYEIWAKEIRPWVEE